MDYSEILIRISEEHVKARKAFQEKQIGKAEFCGYELLRLSMKLLDAAEEFSSACADGYVKK